MEHYKIEALWDCIYCGNKGILGREQDCPGCGHSRGAEVKFYLPSDISMKNAANEADVDSGADWLCSYCKSYNSHDINVCENCGANRDEYSKDYFEINKQ